MHVYHSAIRLLRATLCAALFCNAQAQAAAPSSAASASTATGKLITPTAATGAVFQELDPRLAAAPERRPGGAAAVAISPDGARLAVLTTGFNAWFDPNRHGDLVPEASTENVFVYDIRGGTPRPTQVLAVPNSFLGMSWGPAGRLFVSGGKDDAVIEFAPIEGQLVHTTTIALHHEQCLSGKPDPNCGPVAGPLAISPDGTRLLVTNIQNDSVSLIDLKLNQVVAEQDLRPGKLNPAERGVPGGSYPRAVVWTSPQRAYIGSVRDRELICLDIRGNRIRVRGRVPLEGQPAALLASRQGSRLYVALDTTSQVAVFDTAKGALIEKFNAVAPPHVYDDRSLLGGANTNALALLPDSRTLLVSNGGLNAVAVVRLSRHAAEQSGTPRQAYRNGPDDDEEEGDRERSAVVGLIPTGWYPTGIATSQQGNTWYIVNSKSPPGPNSAWCHETADVQCRVRNVTPRSRASSPSFLSQDQNGAVHLLTENAYINQLEHAGLLSLPAPPPLELARLTRQVARNNRFDAPEKNAADELVFAFLRNHIKHVIYIMKENRSYDQILGDLGQGNGDPRLTLFPEHYTPNHHSIARNFVTLDNLLVSAEGSINGAYWTFAGQTNDLLEHTDTVTLATVYKGERGGFPYGTNRQDDIAYGTVRQRRLADPSYPDDPDILPGTRSVYDVDGPGGEAGAGYIWNAAVKRGLSIRDYGVFRRMFNVPLPTDDKEEPGRSAANPAQILASYSDPAWPENQGGQWIPDYIRVKEWRREFDQFVARGTAPSLTLMYLGGDHFGGFNNAQYGVNTPDTQMADNDYAVGVILEAVAHSPFAKDTLVVTIEDDACDGPDHVDAQRTVALMAGAYVRQHATVSTRYTTVDVVRTIEDVLGLDPISLNDALARPMSDVFDLSQDTWSYEALVPEVLRSTQLSLPADAQARVAYPRHSASYWARVMKGQDFSEPDRINVAKFNRALWRGLEPRHASE